MDIIYSRKRLKIPKLRKFTRLKISLVLIILGLLLFFLALMIFIYPIFEINCKSRAELIAINITSSEINKIMENYNYDDLVYFQRDTSREIALMKVKIVPINEIINKTVSSIEYRINNLPETSVEVNIGNLTGISIFSQIGPKFNVRIITSRAE